MGQRGKYNIIGNRLGVGAGGQVVARKGAGYVNLSQPAVDARITLAAPVGSVRQIAVQLLDDQGDDINYVETVEAIMFANAGMTAFAATGGSTGIAIGSGGDGALLALVAKKVFLLTSEADGDIDLQWTDNASEVAYLGIRLPNGRVVLSGALTI